MSRGHPFFFPARRRCAGGTLLETMFAATVLALVLTSAITTLQQVFALLGSAHNLTVGSEIIATELEKIRLQGWDVVSAYPASATLPVDSNFTSNPRIRSRFTLTRNVTPVEGSGDLLQLTFTVSWRSFGRTVTRSFVTYYAHYGVYDWLYST
jgi:hypothetical protein